jgi:hypothetical protein
MIHGAFSNRMKPWQCDFRTVDDQVFSNLLLSVLVEFRTVKLQTLQEMKIISRFAPKRCACDSSRMAMARKSRCSPQAAAALQHRASLVGNAAKWRITNFKQVARAMSQWA